MTDFLLPRTDTGVAVQALILFPALVAGLVVVRRDRELRIFVIGLLVLSVALFGLRAVH